MAVIEQGIQVNFDSLLKQGLAVIDVRYKEYEITKETYKFIITKIDGDREEFYPMMLKHYTNIEIKSQNLFKLWIAILDHKLKMSKMLNRDISIKVAALDYIEDNGM